MTAERPIPDMTRVARADAPTLRGTVLERQETLGGDWLYHVRWDRGGSSWHPRLHLRRLDP